MKIFTICMAVLLHGCAALQGSTPLPEGFSLTPTQCALHGVKVSGEPGEWREHHVTIQELSEVCSHYRDGMMGCAVDEDFYVAAVDRLCVREHEYCHAAYDSKSHTKQYLLSSGMGDLYAGCGPPKSWLKKSNSGLLGR